MQRIFIILLIISGGVLRGQTMSYTYQPGSTGIDAVITSGAPTTNYGTDVNLSAKNTSGSVKTRGLLQFDLSSIPTTAIITSAKLTLYGTAHTGTSNASYLRQNTSSWTESTVVKRWDI